MRKPSHLRIGSTCVFEDALWHIETRRGGVYQIWRLGETRIVKRNQIKRLKPGTTI